MDAEKRRAIALWRFAVLGPLVSAELDHGDVQALCKQQAARWYRGPDGRRVQPSWRTIEGWYYAYRARGPSGLEPSGRSDVGLSRALAAEVAEMVLTLKRENPRRSIRRIIRILERNKTVRKGELSRSTVHRHLQAHGLSRRPTRTSEKERRAFRHAFANDCWMADVMHGPAVSTSSQDGGLHKAYLHAFIDSNTRFIVGASFRLGERAADFESVFHTALQARGVPRTLYLDNGSAQTADSLASICADLGVYLCHAEPGDAAAKGTIERFFKTVRAELCDELSEAAPPTLDGLNAALWAWVSREYHRREHQGTERVPLDHWLEQAERLRAAPPADELKRIFLHRERRRVRKDNTIRYRGAWLEVPGNHAGEWIEVRFDPSVTFDPKKPETLPQIFQGDRLVGDPAVLDALTNADGRRRRSPPSTTSPPATHSGIDPLAQLTDEQARVTRPPGKTRQNTTTED